MCVKVWMWAALDVLGGRGVTSRGAEWASDKGILTNQI